MTIGSSPQWQHNVIMDCTKTSQMAEVEYISKRLIPSVDMNDPPGCSWLV